MIPKKATKLYTQIADDLSVDTDLVEDLIECFYKDLRENLSNLTNPRLNVEGLGHFSVRPLSVRKGISKYQKALNNHDTSTFNAYYNKKMIENKLEALIDIEKKITIEEERKQKFKEGKK